MPHLLTTKDKDSGIVAGIDLGSTSIKVVIYNGSSYGAWIRDASIDPEESALSLLAEASTKAGLSHPRRSSQQPVTGAVA